MAKTITEQEIKRLIDNAPEGTTSAGIIAGLKEKGYKIEGEKKFDFLGTYMKVVFPWMPKGVVRALGAPQAALTTAAKTIGGVAGGLIGGRPEIAREELVTGGRELAAIPGQIARGEELARPSTALGISGVGGFLADVAGDPLNLLFVGAFQKQAIAQSKQTVPFLQRFGTRMYQSLFRPSTKKVAKEFGQLGKTIEGVVKTKPNLLGENLARYGIKGSVENMLKTMNQRIATLGPKLKNLVSGSTAKISTKPVIDKLDDLMASYRKAGKANVVKTIQTRIDDLKKLGVKEISVDDAVEIKRIYDDLRLTAGGVLSEAQSAEQRVLRIISNGLRNEINKIPKIGVVNRELATYYEGLQNLEKIAAKEAERVLSPITLREFFPYLKVSLGPFAKSKTAIGQAAINLSDALSIPVAQLKATLKALTPAALRNLLD